MENMEHSDIVIVIQAKNKIQDILIFLILILLKVFILLNLKLY